MKFDLRVLSVFLLLSVSTVLQAEDGFSAALHLTLQNNPAIKGQSAEIRAQTFAVNSAEAGRYPTVSIAANNVASVRDATAVRDVGTVRLQQPLWTFGKIDNAIEQAEQNVSIEQQNLLQVQRQLIDRVATAYAKVKGVQRQTVVADVNIKEHKRLLGHISRRQHGQLASSADVSLGKSRLIVAQAQRLRMTGELYNAQAELRALTIVPVTTTATIPKALAALPELSEVEAMALSRNATIHVKRAESLRAKLDVSRARVASLPNLYLRAERDFLDAPIRGDRSRVGVVFESSFEGAGLVMSNGIKGAAARYQSSREDINLTRADVTREVHTLMSDRRIAAELIKVQKEAVAAVEKTMASYFRLYTSGHKTWIDVLNIQREITDQRLQLVRLNTEWMQASLRVAALIGKLDVVSGIKKS